MWVLGSNGGVTVRMTHYRRNHSGAADRRWWKLTRRESELKTLPIEKMRELLN
jgi:hypothetical protein